MRHTRARSAGACCAWHAGRRGGDWKRMSLHRYLLDANWGWRVRSAAETHRPETSLDETALSKREATRSGLHTSTGAEIETALCILRSGICSLLRRYKALGPILAVRENSACTSFFLERRLGFFRAEPGSCSSWCAGSSVPLASRQTHSYVRDGRSQVKSKVKSKAVSSFAAHHISRTNLATSRGRLAAPMAWPMVSLSTFGMAAWRGHVVRTWWLVGTWWATWKNVLGNVWHVAVCTIRGFACEYTIRRSWSCAGCCDEQTHLLKHLVFPSPQLKQKSEPQIAKIS